MPPVISLCAFPRATHSIIKLKDLILMDHHLEAGVCVYGNHCYLIFNLLKLCPP